MSVAIGRKCVVGPAFTEENSPVFPRSWKLSPLLVLGCTPVQLKSVEVTPLPSLTPKFHPELFNHKRIKSYIWRSRAAEGK